MTTPFEFDMHDIPLEPPIGVLIDAGASDCHFARVAIEHFQPKVYRGFEILRDLVERAAADSYLDNGRDRKLLHVGLGDEIRYAAVERAAFSPSSSLLKTNPAAAQWYAPGDMDQAYGGPVSITTLDRFCELDGIDQIDLLKVDVQGYESRLLRGAERMLKATRCVVIEVVFRSHYLGESEPGEIHKLLTAAGLQFVKFIRLYPSHEPLEGDALYLREGA